MNRRPLALVIAFVILVLGVPRAAAQAPRVAVSVVSQPIWHGPDDRLELTLRVSNLGSDAVAGYVVTVTAHGRVLSRSELHASFDSPTTFEASSITAVDSRDEEIPAGESVVLELDDPVTSLQSLSLTSESGVYPLTISVIGGTTGATIATTSTQLIYYPTPPEFRVPTVPIVPIADLPRRSPAGTFETGGDDAASLDTAVRKGGWLNGLVATLDRVTTPTPARRAPRRGPRRPDTEPPALHAAVVTMPRLVEELADMADGFRTDDDERVEEGSPAAVRASNVLEAIRALNDNRGVQPILGPYSFPDLPTLFRLLDNEARAREHLQRQIREAEIVLSQTLGGYPPRNWVYTPGARLNLASLEGLYGLDAARFSFFTEDSLEPLEAPDGGGCPEPPLSFTCPISVTTADGSTTGFVLDQDLQARVGDIASGDGVRAAIQRFFAELATIKEELPSRVDRVIVFALPAQWQPRARTARVILEGLRDAPWLHTMTPREALQALNEVEPMERRIRSTGPEVEDEPDAAYGAEIKRADDTIESFRGVQPPETLLERLGRNMLVSESRLWWDEPALLLEGERYAVGAADEAENELSKISFSPVDEIGLTSREAQIPVTVFNDTAYDVSVTVHIKSNELRLDETFPVTVQANGLRQMTVDVTAQSSGIFQVLATVETPNGREITRRDITVRSTAFNEIALGLTFGALAFLVLFYATRALRSRNTTEAPRA